MKKTLTVAFVGAAMISSAASAQSAFLTDANELCLSIIEGASIEEMGFTPSAEATEVPFMTEAYEGKLTGVDVRIDLGERFGAPMFDVNAPEASVQDYEAIHADLVDNFGVRGVNYDNPSSSTGYRGEIWADKEAMSGPIEDMQINGTELTSVFVQYAKSGFMQTGGRAGVILSYQAR